MEVNEEIGNTDQAMVNTEEESGGGLSDVLCLNVGGAKTTVLRRLLTSFPESMLARRFSGRWDDSIERDGEGNIFVDQDASLFFPMISHLRNMVMWDGRPPGIPTTPRIPQNGSNTHRDYHRMVDYYGLTDALYPTELVYDDTDYYSGAEILGARNAMITTNATLELVNRVPTRRIRTYEARFRWQKEGLPADLTHVGWQIENGRSGGGGSNNKGGDGGYFQNWFGLIFERIGSSPNVATVTLIGFDGKDFRLMNNTAGNVTLDEKNNGELTVRSENFGREWYVDGEKMSFAVDKEYHDLIRRYTSSVRPMFYSMNRTKIEVTVVELDY